MKKRLLSIILALAMICSCVAAGTIGAAAETESEPQSFLERFRRDAELVFDDEFDGDTLDETKWQIATGWGRIEDSYGTIEDGNYVVEDGHLALRAFEKVNYDVTNGKESYKEIQSGEVSSKAAWGDGLIEVRAKLPKGQGVYPAIWTMGRDFDRNSCRWPWSGEIDIMEAVGTGNSDDKNYSTWQTLHTARPNTDSSPSGAAHVATGAGKYTTPNHVPLNDDYHTFWVYFDKEIMIIGVDDAMMDIIDLSNPNLVCFKEWEQWLILGLQMGGLAGTPVRTSYSVWEMLIDYVRVYRFKDTEKYKDYKIFEAEDLETSNSVKTIYELTAPTCINNTNIDDIVVNFEDIEPGTYDVYSSYMGTTTANNAVFDAYLNGNKTGTINTAYENGVLEMKDCYMGRVTLEENCSFEARMKFVSGKKQAMNVDKFMLVKTDADDGIIVNKSNEITTYDSIEVSTADELVAAYDKIKTGGTIKLKNDITMTQTISITKDCTLDLNGFTLNSGELEVAFDTAASLTISYINGKIVTPGKNGKLISFFKTTGDKMKHTVKFENVDVAVTAKTVISFLSGYYARCGYYLNNCTFDFSKSENDGTTNMYLASSIQDKSNKLQGARMTNLEVTSVTVKGNGNNTPFLLANYNGEAQSFKLRDCTIENCKNVFAITNCDSKKVKVTLANDTFTNLSALTDTDDNLAFITVADNNTVYDNSDNTIDLAAALIDFKIICEHEYSNATCTTPATCKYCGKTSGESKADHTPGEPEVYQQADCYRPEKTRIKCSVCGEVLSDEITAPATGHDFSVETVGEYTCTSVPYLRKTCNTCGYVVTTLENKDLVTYGGTGHVVDESSVVEFDNCKDGKGYYYTCSVCGKENIEKVISCGRHELEVTAFTAATESADGSITYECKTCEYKKTKTYKYGTKLVTLDGIPYIATDGYYATPFITPDRFVCYRDADGNEYAADEVIEVTADMTLTTVLHEHTPKDGTANVVAPTCVDEGYTEYVCSECGETYKGNIVAATGVHTYVEKVDSKYLKSTATCSSKAIYYKSCSVCGEKGTETFETGEYDANNHSKTEVRDAKAATCTEEGYSGDTYCKDCGTKTASGNVIAKAAHKLEEIAAKAATHATQGNIAYFKCSICGDCFLDAGGKTTVKEADTILPQIEHEFGEYKHDEAKHWHECECGVITDEGEHTFGEWVIMIEPTEIETGIKERACTVCGYKETEEIAILPPKFIYGDCNADGKINLLDLIALRKHLAKWNVDIDTDAADCNADGKVNLMDLILMRKYLAKWEVKLGPQS